MIATSLTADEEIRRLRKLAEATHDWTETRPGPTAKDRTPLMVAVRRVVTTALVWLGERLAAGPRGSASATVAGDAWQ